MLANRVRMKLLNKAFNPEDVVLTDAWYRGSYSGSEYEYYHIVELDGSEYFPERVHLDLIFETSDGPGGPWNVEETESGIIEADEWLLLTTYYTDIDRARQAFNFAGRARWVITFPDFPGVTITHTEVYWSHG